MSSQARNGPAVGKDGLSRRAGDSIVCFVLPGGGLAMIAPLPEGLPAAGPWLVGAVAAVAKDRDRLSRVLAGLAFGDPAAVWGGDEAPAGCFALLEAARFPDFPEQLDGAGLDYASLMRGEAAEDLRDVAPYLIALPPDHQLARRLLTPKSGNDAHWQLWGSGSVTLIRSRASLDDLLRHFRKFTRIFDAGEGRWNYFRFYAPEAMRGLVAHMKPAPFAAFSAPFLFALTEGREAQPVLVGRDLVRMRDYLDLCVRHAD